MLHANNKHPSFFLSHMWKTMFTLTFDKENISRPICALVRLSFDFPFSALADVSAYYNVGRCLPWILNSGYKEAVILFITFMKGNMQLYCLCFVKGREKTGKEKKKREDEEWKEARQVPRDKNRKIIQSNQQKSILNPKATTNCLPNLPNFVSCDNLKV